MLVSALDSAGLHSRPDIRKKAHRSERIPEIPISAREIAKLLRILQSSFLG
jgi:hypothetical protein